MAPYGKFQLAYPKTKATEHSLQLCEGARICRRKAVEMRSLTLSESIWKPHSLPPFPQTTKPFVSFLFSSISHSNKLNSRLALQFPANQRRANTFNRWPCCNLQQGFQNLTDKGVILCTCVPFFLSDSFTVHVPIFVILDQPSFLAKIQVFIRCVS